MKILSTSLLVLLFWSTYSLADSREFNSLSMEEHETIQRVIAFCTLVYKKAEGGERQAAVYEIDKSNLDELWDLHSDLMRKSLSKNDKKLVEMEGAGQGAYLSVMIDLSLKDNETQLTEHVRDCRSTVEQFIHEYF